MIMNMRDELEDLRDDLKKSIKRRKEEASDLGEHGPHRRRINEESAYLRKVTRKLSGS